MVAPYDVEGELLQPWLHRIGCGVWPSRSGCCSPTGCRGSRRRRGSRVWRKLRRLGAVQLVDGLVALPADPQTVEAFDWLADEVIEAGGEAWTWRARPGSKAAAAGAAGADVGGGRRGVPGPARARPRSAGASRRGGPWSGCGASCARSRPATTSRRRSASRPARPIERLVADGRCAPRPGGSHGEVGDPGGLPCRPRRVRVAAAPLRRSRRRVRVRRGPRRRPGRTRRRSTCGASSCRITTATAASRRSCAATTSTTRCCGISPRLVHEADLADDRYDEPGAPGLDAICRGLTLVLDDERNLEVSGGDLRRPLRAPPPAAARRPARMTATAGPAGVRCRPTPGACSPPRRCGPSPTGWVRSCSAPPSTSSASRRSRPAWCSPRWSAAR